MRTSSSFWSWILKINFTESFGWCKIQFGCFGQTDVARDASNARSWWDYASRSFSARAFCSCLGAMLAPYQLHPSILAYYFESSQFLKQNTFKWAYKWHQKIMCALIFIKKTRWPRPVWLDLFFFFFFKLNLSCGTSSVWAQSRLYLYTIGIPVNGINMTLAS